MAQQGQPGMSGTPQQNQPQPGQPQEPGQEPGTAGAPGYSPAAGPEGASGSMSRSYADEAFITTTLKDSSAEAQMSKLATTNSSSSDVKKYGLNMVQIHTQLANQLRPVANMLGVKAVEKPSKKQNKEIAQLKTLSGPAFDKAYIQDMVKDQKHDVKSFKEEENAAQSPTIKQAARMDEPVLSQHLQVLQQIAENHNVTIASK